MLSRKPVKPLMVRCRLCDDFIPMNNTGICSKCINKHKEKMNAVNQKLLNYREKKMRKLGFEWS